MATQKQRDSILREQYTEQLAEMFRNLGEQVLTLKAGTLAFPVLDSEKNERFIKLVVSVPIGDRETHSEFDAFEQAEEYQQKLKIKQEKAQASAEAKAKKIKQDAEAREIAKQKKAEREREKKEVESGE
jgi:hypothetical protein